LSKVTCHFVLLYFEIEAAASERYREREIEGKRRLMKGLYSRRRAKDAMAAVGNGGAVE